MGGLQTAAHTLGESLGVGELVVVRDIWVFGIDRVHRDFSSSAGQPHDENLHELCVFVLTEPIVLDATTSWAMGRASERDGARVAGGGGG